MDRLEGNLRRLEENLRRFAENFERSRKNLKTLRGNFAYLRGSLQGLKEKRGLSGRRKRKRGGEIDWRGRELWRCWGGGWRWRLSVGASVKHKK